MTVQEAIKELKKHKETLNLWNCLPLDDLQSFDVAIEALEKQILINEIVERLEKESNVSKTKPTDLGFVDEYKWVFLKDAIEIVKEVGGSCD